MAAGLPSLLMTTFAALIYAILFGGVRDIILLVLFIVWRIYPVVSEALDDNVTSHLVKSTEGLLVASIVFQILRISWISWNTVDISDWDGPGRPLLLPCLTKHSRIRPKGHSFQYSYLVVGIPLGWTGTLGGLLSSAVEDQSSKGFLSWFSLRPRPRKGWYDVDAGDYLDRGNAHLGLRGKLDGYLKTQGADPADYPYAYLVTAARFLGYHFNPASFWYLYDADKSLTAMIIEVNNTFGERRMYFLTAVDEKHEWITSNDLPDIRGKSTQDNRNPKVLVQRWPKDFHVSPFNPREGAYSLKAYDPLEPRMTGPCLIDICISLVSSKTGTTTLVARLGSTGAGIDPASLNAWQKLKFLSSWWWVGFLTSPRIVREAAALFFRRKLHVWYRPEPLKSTIGRNADATERALEEVFRRYLRHLVAEADVPLALTYVPSGIPDAQKEVMRSRGSKDMGSEMKEMEFKILTPAFYARFAGYAHDLEAIFCELRESCTVSISRPEMLPRIFLRKPSPPLRTSSYVDYTYFKAIKAFRRRPEPIIRPLTSSQTAPSRPPGTDIREFRISSMDGYVLAQEDAQIRRTYSRTVLRMFIAHRIALGSVPLLEAQRFAMHAWLAWSLSKIIGGWIVGVLSRLGA